MVAQPGNHDGGASAVPQKKEAKIQTVRAMRMQIGGDRVLLSASDPKSTSKATPSSTEKLVGRSSAFLRD